MKFVELEGHAEPRDLLVLARRRTEQRGHDPPDGRRAAVHVAVELAFGDDPHGLVAVDAHRLDVAVEQVQGQLVARAGVDERGDHRMRGVPDLQPDAQLGLPAVQRGAPRRAGGQAPRAVDDLVRAAHEAVHGMDGRAHVGGQTARGQPERRVVPALHAAAGPVGVPHSMISDAVHREPAYVVPLWPG